MRQKRRAFARRNPGLHRQTSNKNQLIKKGWGAARGGEQRRQAQRYIHISFGLFVNHPVAQSTAPSDSAVGLADLAEEETTDGGPGSHGAVSMLA